MSKKISGVNYSRLSPAKSRRARALSRLESQELLGKKVSKEGATLPLTEKDLKRVGKEISILKSRS